MPNIVRQYLLSSFDERWMNFFMRLSTAKIDASTENVHHFRVATRRLLVLLDLLSNILPQSKYEKIRKHLRGLRTNFNALHDTQMIIDSLIFARDKDLDVEPFLNVVQKSERRLHKQAIYVISKLKPDDLFIKSIQIRTELALILAEPDFLNEQILPKLDEGYAEIKKISGLLNPDEVSTIHDLRISYRKFRYMIEILIPILRNYPSEHLALIRTYQDMMGEIQNGEIVLTYLKKISKNIPGKKRIPVLAFFQTNYEVSIATFLQHYSEPPQFWRESKLSTMPWNLDVEETTEVKFPDAIPDILLSETELTSINPNASLSETETTQTDSEDLPSESEIIK